MNDQSLFEATVPPLRHFLRQLAGLASRPDLAAHWSACLGDSFTARQHAMTAIGFAGRTVSPLTHLPLPRLPKALDDAAQTMMSWLEAVTLTHFTGAAAVVVTHRAGEEALTQTGAAYATLYALPNFFFHVTMAYATLRAQGADIGKADFDGWHRYAPGFRFPD